MGAAVLVTCHGESAKQVATPVPGHPGVQVADSLSRGDAGTGACHCSRGACHRGTQVQAFRALISMSVPWCTAP